MKPQNIRLSYGTAAKLGLKTCKQDAPPTTAYLLLDTGCLGACSFCPRAGRNSESERLARITWPEFETDRLTAALVKEPRPFKHICLQTGWNPENEPMISYMVEYFLRERFVLSVTVHPSQSNFAESLLQKGVHHVGIGLDAASPETYEKHKRRLYSEDYSSILNLCRKYPGRIEVHLIFGLGDSEETFIKSMDELMSAGADIALFAFTPLHAGETQPSIHSYRKIQAWRWLRLKNIVSLAGTQFAQGRLANFGISAKQLKNMLADGKAFQTSGCGDCNRPYYNERPGRTIYNHPKELSRKEVEKAFAELLSGLDYTNDNQL